MRFGDKMIGLMLLIGSLNALVPLQSFSGDLTQGELASSPSGLCDCQKEGYPASTCASGCDALSATSIFVGVNDSGCYTWAGTPMSASCCTNGTPNNGAGCPSSSSVFVTTAQQIANSAIPLATTASAAELTHVDHLARGMGAILPSPKPSTTPAP